MINNLINFENKKELILTIQNFENKIGTRTNKKKSPNSYGLKIKLL